MLKAAMAASKKTHQTDTQRLRVLKLVGEELNGEGDKKFKEIAELLRQNPDLMKNSAVATQVMNLYAQLMSNEEDYRSGELMLDRNDLLFAIIPMVAGRRSNIPYPRGSRSSSVSGFIRQKVGDSTVHMMLRLEAMNSIRWEAGQKHNRFYQPLEDAKEIQSLFCDIFKPKEKAHGKDKRLVPQYQKTAFEILKPNIQGDLTRKDDLRLGNALHVYHILQYPIRYAVDEDVRNQAMGLSFAYIDTLGDSPRIKKELFGEMGKHIKKRNPVEADYLKSKIIVIDQESLLQKSFDKMSQDVTEQSDKENYDNARNALENHADVIDMHMKDWRQKCRDFAALPVPDVFQ